MHCGQRSRLVVAMYFSILKRMKGIRWRRREVSVKENFINYFRSSTLHGLTYVGDSTLTWFERSFFAFSFCSVLALSVYFISKLWIKWSASPIIITLNSVSTPLNEFPFPAVTICNMNQARRSAVESIPHSVAKHSLLQTLCANSQVPNVSDSKERWPRFRRFMMEVAQSCDDMLLFCRYGGLNYDCSDIFNTILTDEGLCCIFNGVHPMFLVKNFKHDDEFNISDSPFNDWTPETGYRSQLYLNDRNSYPRPPVGTGSDLGLYIVLNANINDYYCSSTDSYGFKVLLHNPVETPKISFYGMLMPSGSETQIVVTPVLSHSSNAIRSIPIDVRACIFENENHLSYFRTYSRRNCEMECESRLYLLNCNCVMYYMPKIVDDVNICGRSDHSCVTAVKEAIKFKSNESAPCDCLSSCYSVGYDGEMSLARLMKYQFLPNAYTAPVIKDRSVDDLSHLHIFFRENSFRSQKREELIGFTEFLSNTGGLLGLFMGFSVISIIELIYFMTFRPYCAHIRYERENRRQKLKRIPSRNDLDDERQKSSLAVIGSLGNSSKRNAWRTNEKRLYPYVE